ncbi:MAG TPA: hypothetical protein PLQ00_15030, partial [Thermoguttaceae bacterium]|nr:hypothetical protein [Thermoguttaceae bacterium]
KDFALKEARFAMLARSKPERAEQLFREAQEDIYARWAMYELLARSGKAAIQAILKGDGDGKTGAQAAQPKKEVEA